MVGRPLCVPLQSLDSYHDAGKRVLYFVAKTIEHLTSEGKFLGPSSLPFVLSQGRYIPKHDDTATVNSALSLVNPNNLFGAVLKGYHRLGLMLGTRFTHEQMAIGESVFQMNAL